MAHLLVFLFLHLLFCSSTPSAAELPLRYDIDEELPVGTIVADIRRDAGMSLPGRRQGDQGAGRSPGAAGGLGGGDLNGNVTFKLLKARQDLAVDLHTGVMRVTRVIDRDVICPAQPNCVINVDVAVFVNKHVRQVIKVMFNILDVNDNAPKFTRNHITETVSEATVPPAVLFPIQQAEDADSPVNGVRTYRLIPDGPTFSLKVDRSDDGYTHLQLLLNERLDREQQDFYQLTLLAIDGGEPAKTGSTMLHIEVQDVNDNLPVFTNSSYEIEIGENSPPQTSLLSVRAKDSDSGRNSEVTYSFSARTQAAHGDSFSIDRLSGMISQLKTLNHETTPSILLDVEARDAGDGSVPVTARVVVTVRDVNDNSPVIRLEATDTLQTGSGGAGGGGGGREGGGGGGSAANPVVFVTEHSPVGTFVAHLSVSDADGGLNGQVHCSLYSPQFRLVQMYDKEFKVLTSADLDREYVDVHHVVVTCHDRGQPVRSAVLNLTVIVDDINDHEPVFVGDGAGVAGGGVVYNWSITERNPDDAYIGQVTATDSDKDENGAVSYQLNSDAHDLVHIDPRTGVIRASKSLDHELTPLLRFHVLAVDSGVEKKHSSALVNVHVINVNDESPHFMQKRYTFRVSAEAGKKEVGRVVAVDTDAPPYNSFTYYINTTSSQQQGNTPQNVFGLDPITGVLYLLPSFSLAHAAVLAKQGERNDGTGGGREEGAMVYNLVVGVQSETTPRVTTDLATVTVYVTDKDDVITSSRDTNMTSGEDDGRDGGGSARIQREEVEEELVHPRPHRTPFTGPVELAVFIGGVTCALILFSLLLVALTTVSRTKTVPPRSVSMTAAPSDGTSPNSTTYWSNTGPAEPITSQSADEDEDEDVVTRVQGVEGRRGTRGGVNNTVAGVAGVTGVAGGEEGSPLSSDRTSYDDERTFTNNNRPIGQAAWTDRAVLAGEDYLLSSPAVTSLTRQRDYLRHQSSLPRDSTASGPGMSLATVFDFSSRHEPQRHDYVNSPRRVHYDDGYNPSFSSHLPSVSSPRTQPSLGKLSTFSDCQVDLCGTVFTSPSASSTAAGALPHPESRGGALRSLSTRGTASRMSKRSNTIDTSVVGHPAPPYRNTGRLSDNYYLPPPSPSSVYSSRHSGEQSDTYFPPPPPPLSTMQADRAFWAYTIQ